MKVKHEIKKKERKEGRKEGRKSSDILFPNLPITLVLIYFFFFLRTHFSSITILTSNLLILYILSSLHLHSFSTIIPFLPFSLGLLLHNYFSFSHIIFIFLTFFFIYFHYFLYFLIKSISFPSFFPSSSIVSSLYFLSNFLSSLVSSPHYSLCLPLPSLPPFPSSPHQKEVYTEIRNGNEHFFLYFLIQSY